MSDCRLIDLCIVIDSSGSIRDNNPPDNSYDNWRLLLDFVEMVRFFLIINLVLFPIQRPSHDTFHAAIEM